MARLAVDLEGLELFDTFLPRLTLWRRGVT